MNLDLGAKQGGGEKTGPQLREKHPQAWVAAENAPWEMKQQNDLRTQ